MSKPEFQKPELKIKVVPKDYGKNYKRKQKLQVDKDKEAAEVKQEESVVQEEKKEGLKQEGKREDSKVNKPVDLVESERDKKGKVRKKTEETDEEKLKKNPGKHFDLRKQIKKEPLYKSNIGRRDTKSRKYIEENCKRANGPQQIVPGQMLYFDYFEPRTKEELEYYDAKPLTIFFNRVNTENGLRVLGFNIHYYPPRMRYQILDRIFDIWKPMYSEIKTWQEGVSKNFSHFDYMWLMEQLSETGLAFGVRMYDPKLIANMRIVQPNAWSKAVFTEGVFKKKARNAIMQYWLEYSAKKAKNFNSQRALKRQQQRMANAKKAKK